MCECSCFLWRVSWLMNTYPSVLSFLYFGIYYGFISFFIYVSLPFLSSQYYEMVFYYWDALSSFFLDIGNERNLISSDFFGSSWRKQYRRWSNLAWRLRRRPYWFAILAGPSQKTFWKGLEMGGQNEKARSAESRFQ